MKTLFLKLAVVALLILGLNNKVMAQEEFGFDQGIRETPPNYPGGYSALWKFINKNVIYPEAAKKHNIAGEMILSFTVNKDGTLSKIKVKKKLGYGLNEEVVRVLKMCRKWNVALVDGKPAPWKIKSFSVQILNPSIK